MTKAFKLELRLFAFVIVLLIFFMGMIVYAIERYGIDLPTCVTNVKPFSKPQIIEIGPKHFEVHYVANMWRREPAARVTGTLSSKPMKDPSDANESVGFFRPTSSPL